MVFVVAVVKLDSVCTFADIMNGLMALPNLIALLGLNGIAAAETRDYFNNSD
jgi:AGCS family alanine or glycine:cation symporter